MKWSIFKKLKDGSGTPLLKSGDSDTIREAFHDAAGTKEDGLIVEGKWTKDAIESFKIEVFHDQLFTADVVFWEDPCLVMKTFDGNVITMKLKSEEGDAKVSAKENRSGSTKVKVKVEADDDDGMPIPPTPRSAREAASIPVPDSPDSHNWKEVTPKDTDGKEEDKKQDDEEDTVGELWSPDSVEFNGRRSLEKYELSQDMFALSLMKMNFEDEE